jgi:hypothetical protein
MDPYLEAHWRDVHARLIVYACDALQSVLPSSLRARVEESTLLEAPTGLREYALFPDLRVIEYTPRRTVGAGPKTGTDVTEPVLVAVESEPVTETFLEIIDRESGNKVVTVLEFLSPSNKTPGPDREQYIRKQREVCASDANLVEIDLNRFGNHTLAFALANLKPQIRTPYMACVRRATVRGTAEVYPMPLWEQLSVVKIPLRPGEADVLLDLQALVDQCYRNGGYEGTLNYAVDPDPPLFGVDKEWADKWLREKRLRPRKKPPRRKGKRKSR